MRKILDDGILRQESNPLTVECAKRLEWEVLGPSDGRGPTGRGLLLRIAEQVDPGADDYDVIGEICIRWDDIPTRMFPRPGA